MNVRRTSAEALAWLLDESLRPTHNYEGYCLRAVRTAFNVPALYPSAIAAWDAIPAGDRSRSVAPVGVPVWWDVGKFGHVGVSLGSGVVWSTDILRRGRIDVVPEALIRRIWGARYLGWSNTLNGVTVPWKPRA